MDIARIKTARIENNGHIARRTHTVEVGVGNGIGIHLVGLHDMAVKETLLRICTALQANGYRIPGKKIVINIDRQIDDPAPELDLPIAIGILIASGQIQPRKIDSLYIVGELGLDGSIRYVSNGRQLGELAKDKEVEVMLPAESAIESFSQLGRTIHAVENLNQAISVIEGSREYLLYRSDYLENAISRLRQWQEEYCKDDIINSAEKALAKAGEYLTYGGDVLLTAIYLGEKNKYIGDEVFFEQDHNPDTIIADNTRDILKKSVERKGVRGIVLVLKQSAGSPKPDKNDIEEITCFRNAALAFSINLVDAIIVDTGRYFSFSEAVVKSLNETE